MIEESKLGKLNNAQFPHIKAIPIKWGNQFLDEFLRSGDSGIRDISNYPSIFRDFGCQISSDSKSSLIGSCAGSQFFAGL